MKELNHNSNQRRNIQFSYLEEINKPTTTHTGTIAIIIDEFFTDMKHYEIKPIVNDVHFGFMSDKHQIQNENGSCIWNPTNTKVATFLINPEILSNIVNLKTTIYHELGHCVLGLDHKNHIVGIENQREIPLSIMHEAGINDQYVYDHFKIYKSRLFLDGLANKNNYNPTYLNFLSEKAINSFISPIVKTLKFIEGNRKLDVLHLIRNTITSILHILALMSLVSILKTMVLLIVNKITFITYFTKFKGNP